MIASRSYYGCSGDDLGGPGTELVFGQDGDDTIFTTGDGDGGEIFTGGTEMTPYMMAQKTRIFLETKVTM